MRPDRWEASDRRAQRLAADDDRVLAERKEYGRCSGRFLAAVTSSWQSIWKVIEVCDWLTSRGSPGVLWKYRVPDSGPAWHNDCNCNIHPKAPTALEDAKRTVRLVRVFTRRNGAPIRSKIGVLGFSAGGRVVADISTHFEKRAYSACRRRGQGS